MIKAYLYIKRCQEAGIGDLTRTELRVLDELMDEDGWIDEVEYLKRMRKTPIYVTKHQEYIILNLPQREEDPFLSCVKNELMKDYIEKVRLLNREIPLKKNSSRRYHVRQQGGGK